MKYLQQLNRNLTVGSIFKPIKLVLFVSAFSLCLSSCLFFSNDDDDPVTTPDYSDYTTTPPVDFEVDFKPVELYPDATSFVAPSLHLELKTKQEYNCHNFKIEYSKFIDANELIIRLEGIDDYVVCANALGPAISNVSLPENITKVTFINGSKIDQYDISISNQRVDIDPITSVFTTSTVPKRFRIPTNSFAVVCGTNTTNTHLYNDFLDILDTYEFTEYRFQGQGQIPYPETTMGHWVNHPSTYFTYSNEEDFELLETILNDFADNNGILNDDSGVSISIIGWNNRNYYSWM